jgi:hypothetical protein
VIQFIPPGSGCSVIFGKNVTGAAPGSASTLNNNFPILSPHMIP